VETTGLADAVEQRCFGGGHPYLAASSETLEQGRATAGIEMCRDLVQEQDGGLLAPLRNKLGMSQYKPKQQGLLLAGR